MPVTAVAFKDSKLTFRIDAAHTIRTQVPSKSLGIWIDRDVPLVRGRGAVRVFWSRGALVHLPQFKRSFSGRTYRMRQSLPMVSL